MEAELTALTAAIEAYEAFGRAAKGQALKIIIEA
jgi:hypothetical protein